MSYPTIKTCPFCGQLPGTEKDRAWGMYVFDIACRFVHCPVNPFVRDDTKRQAIKRWNTRK